jgi:hypothetical protein
MMFHISDTEDIKVLAVHHLSLSETEVPLCQVWLVCGVTLEGRQGTLPLFPELF